FALRGRRCDEERELGGAATDLAQIAIAGERAFAVEQERPGAVVIHRFVMLDHLARRDSLGVTEQRCVARVVVRGRELVGVRPDSVPARLDRGQLAPFDSIRHALRAYTLST